MKLSKSTIGIIAAVVIICMWAASAYNSMVSEQEKATTAFANVQSAYQRRADLIPNLVEVVKGYAAHEKETFESVVAARAKATQITVDPSNLTADKLKTTEKAETLLYEMGFRDCRVRMCGENALVQVTAAQYGEAMARRNDIAAALGTMYGEVIIDDITR